MAKTNYKLLTREESQDLIRRAQKGDREALQTFYLRNKGLYDSIINRYAKHIPDCERDELYQEAFFGLMTGINHYKETKATVNTRPEGYVFSWVRASITRYIERYFNYSNKERVKSGTNDGKGEDALDAPDESQDLEQYVINKEIAKAFRLARRNMSTLEKRILDERITSDSPVTLRVIGESIDRTRERVRQVELQVKTKLAKRWTKMNATATK